MTHAEIFIQVCSEASGQPKAKFEEAFEMFKTIYPSGHKLDVELPEEEAQKMVNNLRQEKEGIRKWIAQGAIKAGLKVGHT